MGVKSLSANNKRNGVGYRVKKSEIKRGIKENPEKRGESGGKRRYKPGQ